LAKQKERQNKKMTNPIPRLIDPLFALAESAIGGLMTLETPLGIKHNTMTVVGADLLAARAAHAALGPAISARLGATEAEQSADANGQALITTTRDVLKSRLGTRYSQAWYEVGYRNHSLSMPATMEGRLELLKHMSTYFGAHQDQEDPALKVTKQELGIRHDTLGGCITALQGAWTAQRAKKKARDVALAALRARLGNLLRELRQLLAADDPRWESFGFNIPADHSTPAAPANLTVIDGLRGHLLVSWDKTRSAERYRVRKQIIGVHDDWVVAKTTSETEADLNTFVTGQRVLLEVTALNGAGESVPSEPVEHVIP
jgi:hypothetical protein